MACGLAAGLACEKDEEPAGCGCFVKTADATTNNCESALLCGPITVTCGDSALAACPAELLTTSSEGAIDCALQAIVDGTRTRIEWSVENGLQPGYSGQDASLSLVGDGTAYSWGRTYEDLGQQVAPAAHVALRDAGYFEACMTLTTGAERFVCLRDGQEAGPLETCVAGFYADYF